MMLSIFGSIIIVIERGLWLRASCPLLRAFPFVRDVALLSRPHRMQDMAHPAYGSWKFPIGGYEAIKCEEFGRKRNLAWTRNHQILDMSRPVDQCHLYTPCCYNETSFDGDESRGAWQ